MNRRAPLLLAFLGLVAPTLAHATPPARVEVEGARVTVADVVRNAPSDAASVDLGPSPALGGSRLIDRDTILRALREHQATEPARIPEAVRVFRRTRTLRANELEEILRNALPRERLPRGAALTAIHAPRTLDVPAGWSSVTAEIPRPPRRAGPFVTTAQVSFVRDTEVLARVTIPIDLTFPPEAVRPDLARGSAVTLLVRQGLVEVRVSASAGTDADVGDTIPVVLRPAGRVLRARLIERDVALAVEGP